MNTENGKKESHLGKKVQKIREVAGIKQSALAELTGLSQQYISRLEGRAYIPDKVLEKLAEALGITTGWIKAFDEGNALLNVQGNFFFRWVDQPSHPAYTTEQEQLNRALLLCDRLLNKERKKLAETQKKVQSLSQSNKELSNMHKKLKEEENILKRLSTKNPNMSTLQSQSPNETIIHWGYCVKTVREGQGLTIKDTAEKTGLTETRIQELESSQSIPTDILENLGNAMGVKVELIRAFGELTIGKNSQHNSASHNYQNNYSTVHYQIPNIVLDMIDKYIVGKKEPEAGNSAGAQ